MLVTGSALLVVDGRESPLPMASTERGPLFSLQTIVAALGGELEVGPFGQAHTLEVLDVPLVFGPGNSVMTVEPRVGSLCRAVRLLKARSPSLRYT